MNRTSRMPLVAASLAVVALVATAGAAVLHAGSDSEPKSHVKIHLRTDGDLDRIELDDLDSLEVGERRDYATDSGKPVTVTRDDDGYALEVDGKTLRIGGDDGLEPRHPAKMKMRRIEIDGDGDPQRVVITGEPHEERIVVRRHADGEQGFAFSTGDGPHALFAAPGLLARIERSEKFLALDDATRELVRELVREASAPMKLGGAGEAGDAVEVWIERRAEGDDEN